MLGWLMFYMVCLLLCVFGIYLLWVIYKLLAGSRSLFALTLLFLSSIWWIYWIFYYSITIVSKYLAWALPLQCWIFANRYFQSYLKSNATTTKFTLTMHTYITVIFSIVIVALCTVFGNLGSRSQLWNCFENPENDRQTCYRLESKS